MAGRGTLDGEMGGMTGWIDGSGEERSVNASVAPLDS